MEDHAAQILFKGHGNIVKQSTLLTVDFVHFLDCSYFRSYDIINGLRYTLRSQVYLSNNLCHIKKMCIVIVYLYIAEFNNWKALNMHSTWFYTIIMIEII